MKKVDLPPAVSRWIMYFQQYSFEVEHRKNERMKHVDALSRCYAIFAVENEVLARIRKAQKEDEWISTIVEILKDKSYEDFFMKDELLFKRFNGKDLLVIPKLLQKEIIRTKHEDGHFGTTKVEYIVSRDFFIPKLKIKVEEVIKNCVKCILANNKCGKQEGFLHPIDKEGIPMQTIHIDHLGPMDLTSKQYKYILSIIDGFSKFVWLYPTKSLTSEEVIKKLEEQKKCFGNPKRIISDRGTAFTSGGFKKYCEEENIEHILTTTGVPRGNGQVERLNRIIINVLTKYAYNSPAKWFQHVGEVQQNINSSLQRAIQKTPYAVMFGIRMKKKDDVNLQNLIEEEMIENLTQSRDLIRLEAREQIRKIQEENKKSYNKKRKPERLYKEGDLVAIKRTQFGVGQKLANAYLGPYEVTKTGSLGRYGVKRVNDGLKILLLAWTL